MQSKAKSFGDLSQLMTNAMGVAHRAKDAEQTARIEALEESGVNASLLPCRPVPPISRSDLMDVQLSGLP